MEELQGFTPPKTGKMGQFEKGIRKSVSEFFKSIENFDESAIYTINITNTGTHSDLF